MKRQEELAHRREQAEERNRYYEDYYEKTTDTVKTLGEIATMSSQDAFKGFSWHINLSTGLGIGAFPLIENHTGSSINSYSSIASAMGLGLYIDGELWPLYGDYFGVGGFGKYEYRGGGNEVVSGATVIGYYGGKVFLGGKTIKIIGEFGTGNRSGEAASDMATYGIDATGYGQVDYLITRVGYGVRFNFDRDVYFDIILMTDSPDYLDPETDKPEVWVVTSKIGLFMLKGEYASEYPPAGKPEFPLEEGGESYFSLGVGFVWDIFGEPYF